MRIISTDDKDAIARAVADASSMSNIRTQYLPDENGGYVCKMSATVRLPQIVTGPGFALIAPTP